MLYALTRAVSPQMAHCELTHLRREPIDIALALAQHAQYEAALVRIGCQLIRTTPLPDFPDSVFVEDTVLVLDEVAVITHPGADSRKGETASVAQTLRHYRPLLWITSPGVLDGGDVLRLNQQLWVGLSSRSNMAAIVQLQEMLRPYGYEVTGASCKGCLHLKSAITRVSEDTLLCNPDWVDVGQFDTYRVLHTDPAEPGAANALLVNGKVVYSSSFPRTLARIEAAGIEVVPVDNSEFIKAEGGVTCSSVVFSGF